MNRKLVAIIIMGILAIASLFFVVSNVDKGSISVPEVDSVTEVIVEDNEIPERVTPSVNSDGEPEDFATDEDDPVNEPIVSSENIFDNVFAAYAGEVPREPSQHDARNGFPDSNENKVRDDIEVLIVDEYKNSAALVETLFAHSRLAEYQLGLAQKNQLTEDNVNRSNDLISKAVRCGKFVQRQLGMTTNQIIFESPYEIVTENYFNTDKRVDLREKLVQAMHGTTSRVEIATPENCKAFAEMSSAL